MEDVVNNNIDLFVNLEYNETNELIISVLISDNNQVVNVGEFKKDTKTNIERFTKLYNGLKKPFIIVKDVEGSMKTLFSEFRKHNLTEYTKIFHDYHAKKELFIEINNNFFLSNGTEDIIEKELYLFHVFLNYIYFEYNVKTKEENRLFNLNLDNEEETKTLSEYEQKVTNLRYKVIEDFKMKSYYDELLELLGD